jgi:hypothetical protein
MSSKNTTAPQDPEFETRSNRQPKMPIYRCSCGAEILIVPDLNKMIQAISNHLVEHKKITGERLSEIYLTQEILACLSKKIS